MELTTETNVALWIEFKEIIYQKNTCFLSHRMDTHKSNNKTINMNVIMSQVKLEPWDTNNIPQKNELCKKNWKNKGKILLFILFIKGREKGKGGIIGGDRNKSRGLTFLVCFQIGDTT